MNKTGRLECDELDIAEPSDYQDTSGGDMDTAALWGWLESENRASGMRWI